MTRFIKTLAFVASGTLLATPVFAQSARDVLAPMPFLPISADSQPEPRIFADPPLPGPLAYGAATILFRVENIRILPVFGAAANDITPRVGHLHVTVDNHPWHWATAADEGFISVAPLPPGRHSVLIEVAAPDHRVLVGQTVTFTVPESAAMPQSAPHAH